MLSLCTAINYPVTKKGLPLRSFLAEGGQTGLILVGLVAMILGVAGTFVWQQVSRQVATPQPFDSAQGKPTSSSVPTPTPDPTGNWKTYTNGSHKFSFKHPEDWTIKEETDQRRAFGLMSTIVSSPTKKSFIDIVVQPGTKEQLEKEFAEKATQGKVGNITTWIMKTREAKTLHFPSVINGQTINIVYGVVPNSSPESEIQVADQIISTFRFE